MPMKRIFAWIEAAAVAVSVAAVTAQSQSNSQRGQAKPQRTEQRQQRHEERVKQRAARLAAFEKHMDSLILSRNFQFNPSSMQQQPAGPLRQLMNPNFSVGVWDGTVDVCLPYIKGYVAPYYYTVLNYVLPSVEGYRAEQTSEGWIVSFSSTLFSSNDYTFTFDIYSSSGSANLTITSVWYNPVQYTGTITQVY